MSAATMNGSDAVKATSSASSAASSKQQVKGGSSSGKALEGARKQAASPLDSQNKCVHPLPYLLILCAHKMSVGAVLTIRPHSNGSQPEADLGSLTHLIRRKTAFKFCMAFYI